MMKSRFEKAELQDSVRVINVDSRTVKFQDVDAAGTIFFPRVLEYFSDCYGSMLARSGLDVPKLIASKELAAPLVHVEADYLRPLFFGDEVRVEMVKANVGTTSVSFGYRIIKGEAMHAFGTTCHVFISPASFRPIPIPTLLADFLNRD